MKLTTTTITKVTTMQAADSAELLALQRIDETCMQLQQQGNYLEALECMERGLVLRQHFFGSDSDEVCVCIIKRAHTTSHYATAATSDHAS